jgi:hypothetical protein
LEGQHGKFHQCASRASCRAQSGTGAGGETGSSNFGDRVAKRFWNIPESKPTEANCIGSFAAENGAGTKGEMGEDSNGIEASGGGENNWLGSREAHHFGSRTEKDRRRSKSEVGEVEDWEEGGVGPDSSESPTLD